MENIPTVPEIIALKVNVMAWPEFELAYFDSTVKHFYRYDTVTLTLKSFSLILIICKHIYLTNRLSNKY